MTNDNNFYDTIYSSMYLETRVETNNEILFKGPYLNTPVSHTYTKSRNCLNGLTRGSPNKVKCPGGRFIFHWFSKLFTVIYESYRFLGICEQSLIKICRIKICRILGMSDRRRVYPKQDPLEPKSIWENNTPNKIVTVISQ